MGLVKEYNSRILAARRFVWFPQISDDATTRWIVVGLCLGYLVLLPFVSRKALTIPYQYVIENYRYIIPILFSFLILQVLYMARRYNMRMVWWITSALTTSTLVTAACGISLLAAGEMGVTPPAGTQITIAYVVTESVTAAIAFLALVKAFFFGEPKADMRNFGNLIRRLDTQLEGITTLSSQAPATAKEATQTLFRTTSELIKEIDNVIGEYGLTGLKNSKKVIQGFVDEARMWPADVWSRETAAIGKLRSTVDELRRIENWQ